MTKEQQIELYNKLSVKTLEAIEIFLEQQDNEEVYNYVAAFLKQKRLFAEQKTAGRW